MERHNEFADHIWLIKEYIRDEYAEKDYEDVILPFTLLRRIDCVLEPTHDDVFAKYTQYNEQAAESVLDGLLKNASGCGFYNVSQFTLAGLVKDPANIGANFDAYLKGFSQNIREILLNFSGGEEKGLSPIYETLLRKQLLYIVTLEFTKIDLHPETVSNHDMGTIFEILIRKSKETTNEKAGQYYTPREIVRLMVNLVFSHDTEELKKPGKIVSIYDPCCGTGGMLTTAKDYLQESINADLTVYTFGQEVNEQTYAIAKSDILMKGENADNIKQGNTITRDHLSGKTFNYMLTNPPFGDDWKNMRTFVEDEEELGFNGRFGAGTPDVSDGSLLFLQHMISKMHPQGSTIGIVFNGSPLFNGDAGGGWSSIRGWIMDEPNDLLDCIVALPKDLFYGTGIGTYVWILNNHKPENRRGKVQLINAIHSPFFTKLRKSLGKKQVEISEDGIRLITQIYNTFRDHSIEVTENGAARTVEVSKIFDVMDFKYTKVIVDRPFRLAFEISDEKIEALKQHSKFRELATSKKKDKVAAEAEIKKGLETQEHIVKAVESIQESQQLGSTDARIMNDESFFHILKEILDEKPNKGFIKMYRDSLGERDEAAKVVFNDPFKVPDQMGRICDWEEKPLSDSELRDSENIAWKLDIDEYFEREVLPFAPDAWMDREKDKIGYEIPFTKFFYEYKPLRELSEIMRNIEALEEETEDLLDEIKDEKHEAVSGV